MRPTKFFREVTKRSLHGAWHLGHKVHFLIILAAGALVWLGIHFEEHSVIFLPFTFVVLAAFAGLLWHAYAIYYEEHNKRLDLERQLTATSAAAKEEAVALRSSLDDRRATLGDVRDFMRRLLKEGQSLMETNAACQPWIDRVHRFADEALISGFADQFRRVADIPQPLGQKHRVGNCVGILGTWCERIAERDIKSTLTLTRLASL